MFRENIFAILLLTVALGQRALAYKECRFPSNYIQRQTTEKDKDLPATQQLTKFIIDHGSNFYFKLPFGSFGRRLCRLPSDYTLRQPNPDDKKLPAVLQLDKFIMDAVANFHFVTTLKSKNAFETVIKELQIMPNTESAVQEFQSKILDFEKQYEPCNTAERQKFMASIYPEMMSKYPLKLEDCKNDDERLVVKVLNKFNIHNPRTMFEQDIADFVKIFEEKFQELKEPIKRENVEFSNELNKWFEEMYNTKTDIFDKAQRIIQLPYQPFFATNARNNVFSFQ